MIANVPWWTWLLPLGRPLLSLLLVVLAGIAQRRITGTWPRLIDWCAAITVLRPFPEQHPQIPDNNPARTKTQSDNRHRW
jgi:hypothetical protein